MTLYLFARLLRFLFRHMPQKSMYALALVVGDLLHLGWRRARRNAQENMRRALGPGATRKQVNRAVRNNFRNYTRWYAEFLRGHDGVLGRVNIHGLDNIDMALADGKGVIVVTLHMGSVDAAAITVARSNYPMNVVVDKVINDRVNRWIQGVRVKFGLKVIAAKREAVPNLLKSLRRNEVLAMLIDCPRLGNIKVKFCGAKAKVPGGPAALALRTGARIIPTAMVRTKGNRFTTYFDKPLNFEPTGDFARDVQALTQKIMDSMEQTVRAYPDQWFMFRRIWV